MLRSKPRTTKLLAGALAATAALAASALAAPCASAAEPWWHLSVSSRPSDLRAGVAQDEAQEIKVAATGGKVTVIEPVSLEAYFNGGGFAVLKYTVFPYNAEASVVQSALETIYGAGNVQVTGGPGDAAGTKPYLVTFVGGLADQPLEQMVTQYNLEGLEGEATVTEKTKGRSDGEVVLLASNLGEASMNGGAEPIAITNRLPKGLALVKMEAIAGNKKATMVCPAGSDTCTFAGALAPYEPIEARAQVVVAAGASSGEEDTATVSGGGAQPVSAGEKLSFGSAPAFGVQGYELTPEEEGGALDTRAGSHPFQLTTTLNLNQTGEGEPVRMPKDLNVELPPGLLGNPTPFPRCTVKQFLTRIGSGLENECAPGTAVGVSITTIDLGGQVETGPAPIFNLDPEAGEPARFGFYAAIVPIILDTSVRTGGDYGVTVSSHNINQIAGLLGSQVTFWGVPGDARHDDARGSDCLNLTQYGVLLPGHECRPSGERTPPPLLSMPTSCTGPLLSSVEADSWPRPGAFQTFGLTAPLPGMDGCNRLPFDPSLSVAPDVEDASSPSGLTVGVHVPQQLVLNATALAESTLKDTTVELPPGVTVNPGGGDGLAACSEGQIGYLGRESPAEVATEAFSPTLPTPFCPDAAKLGTVKITTPLLPNPLTGAVYLASPAPSGEAGRNPFRTLLAMYIVAEDPVSGTLVKLPGKVELDENTGQLVSTFQDTPQLPFEDLTLHFFGGDRAPLATPGLCGSYTTRAIFAPWSGNAPVTATSTFEIGSGPSGGPCPSNPRPFAPEFHAGTTNNQAGAYSELRTTMGHPDEDQALGALSVTMPPGISGLLSHVKLCEEPQAAEGTCGPQSLIGHTTVTAGLGSTPVVVARPGSVYITGPYNGHGPCRVGETGCAPFGLSIANPAEAGPFDLEQGTKCDCIVVRAKIEVDPITAQLTISSGKLPTMVKGIPLDLQHVSVQIDRPEFTFNPTSCAKTAITGSMSGAEGAGVAISEPFQATNCATLAFEPSFKVSTSGKTSRADGASLHVRLTYPKDSLGRDANIRSVKVDLPKQLPSRLPTLQHACTAATFAANPANCPAASRVGSARATTPLLPVPLQGPAYFVSHGGAAFPELVVVLQGYGVTVDLHGETFINERTNITSSTFRTVPDVPVGTFELTLPEGRYSALAANANLCTSKLAMPTAFTAQNGATIHRSTKIAATGCAKKAKRSRKASRKR